MYALNVRIQFLIKNLHGSWLIYKKIRIKYICKWLILTYRNVVLWCMIPWVYNNKYYKINFCYFLLVLWCWASDDGNHPLFLEFALGVLRSAWIVALGDSLLFSSLKVFILPQKNLMKPLQPCETSGNIIETIKNSSNICKIKTGKKIIHFLKNCITLKCIIQVRSLECKLLNFLDCTTRLICFCCSLCFKLHKIK